MFFPEKEKSYREAYRVLAPGDRYVFSVWDTGASDRRRFRQATFAGAARQSARRADSGRSRDRYRTAGVVKGYQMPARHLAVRLAPGAGV